VLLWKMSPRQQSALLCMVASSWGFQAPWQQQAGMARPLVRAAPSGRAVAVMAEKGGLELAAELEAQARLLREEASNLEAELEDERVRELEGELDDFFSQADADGDGRVSLEELRAVLRRKLVDENANARSAARAARALESEERVLAILEELDANADGALQREEMISIEKFRDRLESDYRQTQTREMAARQQTDFENTTAARLEAWEGVANRTSIDARLVAAAAYLLPALDALPYSIPPPENQVYDVAVAAIVQAAVAFRALPFSGILFFLVLSFVAGNVSRPRLERFAARHAILIDLVAVLLLPLLGAVAPDLVPPVGSAVEAATLLAALTALAGFDADFFPGTGTLAKRFTDEFDVSVKNLLQSATAAEFSLLINGTAADDSNSTSS